MANPFSGLVENAKSVFASPSKPTAAPVASTLSAPSSAPVSPVRTKAISELGPEQIQSNVKTFGRMLKAKYPMYSKADDLELGRRMLEKHPQYESGVLYGKGLKDPDALTTWEKSKGIGEGISTFPAAVPGLLGKATQLGSVVAASPFALAAGAQGLAEADTLDQVGEKAKGTWAGKVAKNITDFGQFSAKLGEKQSEKAGEYGLLYEFRDTDNARPMSEALLPENASEAKKKSMKDLMSTSRETMASMYLPTPGVAGVAQGAKELTKQGVKEFVMGTGLPVARGTSNVLEKSAAFAAGGSLAGAESALYTGQDPLQGAKYGSMAGLIPGVAAAGKYAKGALPVVGNKIGSKISSTAESLAPGAMKDAAVAKFGEREMPFTKNEITGKNTTLNEIRRQAAGMDESIVPVLENTSAAELEEKLRRADQAVRGKSDFTLYHEAAKKAGQVDEQVNAKIAQEVAKREEMLKPVDPQPFVGSNLRKQVPSILQQVGLKLDSKGRIKSIRGKGSLLTEKGFDKDLKVISDVLEDALKEGSMGEKRFTAKMLQTKLYENGVKTVSPKTEAVVKQIEGLLNAEIKAQMPAQYREIQAQLSEMIDFSKRSERLLSPNEYAGQGYKPSNRGEMAMKRLGGAGTTTQSDILEWAQKAKELTGVDLLKEAKLSHFAMQAAGDARAGQLFKEIQEASKGGMVERTLRFLANKLINANQVEIAREIAKK